MDFCYKCSRRFPEILQLVNIFGVRIYLPVSKTSTMNENLFLAFLLLIVISFIANAR